MTRITTLIVCGADAIVLVLAVVGYLGPVSDQATAGMDYVALVFVAALFTLTTVPSFVLVLSRRSRRSALGLSLAFPAILLLLFIAAIAASR
jgi:hypothetical protein